MVVGRIALYLAALLLGPSLGLPMPAEVFIKDAVTVGWPGMALQLVALPFVAKRLERLATDKPGA